MWITKNSENKNYGSSTSIILILLVIAIAGIFAAVNKAQAKITDVVITKEKFMPQIITIQKGEQIRWVNQSPFAEDPESLHHGYSDEIGPDFIHRDYPALSSPDRKTEIPSGGSRTTSPLNQIGWYGYHNHNAGAFWQGVVIVNDPITGLPNLDFLQSKIPQRPLRFGMSGQEVRDLQTFLSYSPAFYPEGEITGYFGKATEEAVSELQEHHAILHESFIYDNQNFGVYEQKTINFLNSLFGNLKASLPVPDLIPAPVSAAATAPNAPVFQSLSSIHSSPIPQSQLEKIQQELNQILLKLKSLREALKKFLL